MAESRLCGNCRTYKAVSEMTLSKKPPYRWECNACIELKTRLRKMTPAERDLYLQKQQGMKQAS